MSHRQITCLLTIDQVGTAIERPASLTDLNAVTSAIGFRPIPDAAKIGDEAGERDSVVDPTSTSEVDDRQHVRREDLT